jgi:acetoin utilization deacetylase AcuC-like enzyme
MSTAVFTDSRFDAHTWHGHVESAERLVAIRSAISRAGLWSAVQQFTPQPAEETLLNTIHTPHLLRLIRQMSSYGGGQFDSDTYVTADSWDLACLAAGAAVGAANYVLDGPGRNAFALVRPPGHHATPSRAMGFCLINNIAAAARNAIDRYGLERVAIVDFDVHHGNGTQDIFYDEPRVLFCSVHAAHFYPGTGVASEVGSRATAHGATLNVPLPYGSGDTNYAAVFDHLITPALRRFQPQLILASAGYDAHWRDPLGPMALSVAGYHRITQTLIDCASELCGGRLAFVLEGGYNLEALGACVVAALRQLLGRDPGPDPFGGANAPEPDSTALITAIRAHHPLLTTTP